MGSLTPRWRRRRDGLQAFLAFDGAPVARLDEPPPRQPCGCCRGRLFWRRPVAGGWVCARCHPWPQGTEPETWWVGDEI